MLATAMSTFPAYGCVLCFYPSIVIQLIVISWHGTKLKGVHDTSNGNFHHNLIGVPADYGAPGWEERQRERERYGDAAEARWEARVAIASPSVLSCPSRPRRLA